MKVYDCFSFFNELDLLEIRLTLLDPVVDRFVIAEADRTHSNQPKPLYFESDQGRFKRFLDKITYVKVTDFPVHRSSWAYENHQRNQLANGITHCSPDDIILISDLDEIPNPEVVRSITDDRIFKFRQQSFAFFLNYRAVIMKDWHGTAACRYRAILTNEADRYQYEYSNVLVKELNEGTTFSKIRLLKNAPVLKNGGWHFTYLGGKDKVIQKIEGFAHQEFNNENYKAEEKVKRVLARGYDLYHPKDNRFVPVRVSTLPFADIIQSQPEKYSHLIYPVDTRALVRSWLINIVTLIRYYLFRKPFLMLKKTARKHLWRR